MADLTVTNNDAQQSYPSGESDHFRGPADTRITPVEYGQVEDV